MIDFSIPPELQATQQRVTAFMDQYVCEALELAQRSGIAKGGEQRS